MTRLLGELRRTAPRYNRGYGVAISGRYETSTSASTPARTPLDSTMRARAATSISCVATSSIV